MRVLSTRRRRAFLCASVLALGLASALAWGCGPEAENVQARGRVLAADGTVLAESVDVSDGEGVRAYPQGGAAAVVVGSCYAHGAPEGIEQVYESELLSGEDVQLTLDLRAQKAAFDALGERAGAAVVLDPGSGAVLAAASTPSYDPSGASAETPGVENRACRARIPGSTFKTVTLAAALESGGAVLDSRYPAPDRLVFDEGTVVNAGGRSYGEITLEEAYAESVNTVFAQLALDVGMEGIDDMARRFGFGEAVMDDFPLEQSSMVGVGDMSPYEQAWSGVGQAVYRESGDLRGPVMSPVHGAAIAAAIADGGTMRRPYIVQSVGGRALREPGDPQPESNPVSAGTASLVADCMRRAVSEGTGRSAAVPGVDVGGKTGTAETLDGSDDGWFMGFAQAGDARYAVAVVVEGAESPEACSVAAELVGKLMG